MLNASCNYIHIIQPSLFFTTYTYVSLCNFPHKKREALLTGIVVYIPIYTMYIFANAHSVHTKNNI